jgi:hypothetical protein
VRPSWCLAIKIEVQVSGKRSVENGTKKERTEKEEPSPIQLKPLDAAFLSTNHEIDPSFGGWFLFPQTFFLYRNYTPSHTTSETRGQSPSGQR